MTIRYSTLRNVTVVLLLAAVCALAYLYFFHPKVVTVAVPAPPPPEFARLSALVDAHIDTIFSPLDAQVPPIPHQELRMLRERFADGRVKTSVRAQPMYRTATQVCDALLSAIQERERASVSLADTRSKPYGVELSLDKKKAEEEQRRFFEFNIVRRWAEKSKPHRDRVVNLYSQLRAQERDFVSRTAGDSTEADGTIVLQHPASVQLRYGSATLPAGLRLRVIERNPAGLVVDYAGEHITLPQP